MDDDISVSVPITTWDVLKKKLREQFLLCNDDWLARESLRKLKQEHMQITMQASLSARLGAAWFDDADARLQQGSAT